MLGCEDVEKEADLTLELAAARVEDQRDVRGRTSAEAEVQSPPTVEAESIAEIYHNGA